MKVLSDRSVLDVRTVRQHQAEEQARRLDVHFEQNARQIQGVRILKDTHQINPLAPKFEAVQGRIRK